MRAVVQRVTEASVAVGGEIVARIGPGLLALVAARHGDDAAAARWLAEKLVHLRIFDDDEGKLNRSVLDTGGSALIVSQFTLYGDARKGRRPSYIDAAPPEAAEPLVEAVAEAMRGLGVPTQTGRFRAHMRVTLVNDGPVTLILETPAG